MEYFVAETRASKYFAQVSKILWRFYSWRKSICWGLCGVRDRESCCSGKYWLLNQLLCCPAAWCSRRKKSGVESLSLWEIVLRLWAGASWSWTNQLWFFHDTYEFRKTDVSYMWHQNHLELSQASFIGQKVVSDLCHLNHIFNSHLTIRAFYHFILFLLLFSH